MAFNVNAPEIDPNTLKMPLPGLGSMVQSGLQGYEQGGKLRDMIKAKRFQQALTEAIPNHDYQTPEGQAALVKELSQKGFGPEAMDLASKFPKAPEPEDQIPFDAGSAGVGTVGKKSGKFKPLTQPGEPTEPGAEAPQVPVISKGTEQAAETSKAAKARAEFEIKKFAREQAETERHNRQIEATAARNAAKEAAPKQPTTDQSKVATFGRRVKQAMGEMDRLENEGYDRSTLKAGMKSKLPNAAQDAQTQQQTQAERNFVNAVLRRESGAAISSSEFANAEKQYFPRTGDSPEVKAQKARNRQQVAQGFQSEAGPAWGKVEGVAVPGKAVKVGRFHVEAE